MMNVVVCVTLFSIYFFPLHFSQEDDQEQEDVQEDIGTV